MRDRDNDRNEEFYPIFGIYHRGKVGRAGGSRQQPAECIIHFDDVRIRINRWLTAKRVPIRLARLGDRLRMSPTLQHVQLQPARQSAHLLLVMNQRGIQRIANHFAVVLFYDRRRIQQHPLNALRRSKMLRVLSNDRHFMRRPIRRRTMQQNLPKHDFSTPLLVGLAVLFAIEASFSPMTVYPFVPGPEPRQQFLAEQPGDFAVVEFPTDPRNHTLSSRQIFNSVHHWKRLLVGYSGFQTEENIERLERLNSSFPADECLDELEDLGVRYVMVLEARYGPRHLRQILQQPRLRQVQRFGDTGIYELLPR